MGVAGKRVANGPKVDCSGWSWGVDLDSAISLAVTSLLREVFEDDPPDAYSPYAYGEADDPLSIRVNIPVGQTYDESPKWDINIREVMDYMLSNYQCRDGSIDSGARPRFAAISTALRQVAGDIDDALDIPAPPKKD